MDIIHVFQRELNRLLSPMEIEIIKEWQSNGFSDNDIKNGLRTAVYNGVSADSFKYIFKILKNIKATEEAANTIINNDAKDNAEPKQDNATEVKEATNIEIKQDTNVVTEQTNSAETEEEPDLSWL